MDLFGRQLSNHDTNLVNALVDDAIEDFLYELVSGKPQNDSVFVPETTEAEKKPEIQHSTQNKNKPREYIKLPDARIKKYKYKPRDSEIKRDNATTKNSNKKQRRNRNTTRRPSDKG